MSVTHLRGKSNSCEIKNFTCALTEGQYEDIRKGDVIEYHFKSTVALVCQKASMPPTGYVEKRTRIATMLGWKLVSLVLRPEHMAALESGKAIPTMRFERATFYIVRRKSLPRDIRREINLREEQEY